MILLARNGSFRPRDFGAKLGDIALQLSNSERIERRLRQSGLRTWAVLISAVAWQHGRSLSSS